MSAVQSCVTDAAVGRCVTDGAPQTTAPDMPSMRPNALHLGREVARNRKAIRQTAAKGDNKQHKSLRDISKGIRNLFEDVVSSTRFDNVIGTLIILNALTIGIQTDYMARHVTDQVPWIFLLFERIFCIIFAAELSLRIYVHKCAFWNCRRPGWMWNLFDTFVVSAQIIEEFFVLVASKTAGEDGGGDMGNFRFMSVMRILRLVRILRVVRVLRLISELRAIVSSIVGSLQSLGWTVILLTLMIYIVGVYFTQSITDHLVAIKAYDEEKISGDDGNAALQSYFGSLFRTILSLFQAMSGGLDWDTLANPLIEELNPMMGLAFAAYIAFALLALMNVVTGVFVQTALQSAKNEEDAFLRTQIVSLFNMENSTNNDGVITWSSIQECLNDPQCAKEWRAIDVQPEDARYLFNLLDIDKVGVVKFEEFLSGCLRLHGPSKAFDLLTVMQELRGLSLRVGTQIQTLNVLVENLHAESQASVGSILSWLRGWDENLSTLCADVVALSSMQNEEKSDIRLLQRRHVSMERTLLDLRSALPNDRGRAAPPPKPQAADDRRGADPRDTLL